MQMLSYCKNCLTTLSDPTRIKILELLSQKSSLTVNEIVGQFPLRQPTISHHLQVLRSKGFVKTVKQGNEVHYSLNRFCSKNPDQTCVFFESRQTLNTKLSNAKYNSM